MTKIFQNFFPCILHLTIKNLTNFKVTEIDKNEFPDKHSKNEYMVDFPCALLPSTNTALRQLKNKFRQPKPRTKYNADACTRIIYIYIYPSS